MLLMPTPALSAAFIETGRRMRPLRELLGDEDLIFCFSDYREKGRYSTSTLFLTTKGQWEDLTRRLEQIRATYKVESRALQFKKLSNWRKRWPRAIEPWLEALRETPSLTVCAAYSKRIREARQYRAFLDDVNLQFQTNEQRHTARDAEAAVWKTAPFFIVAPLLHRGAVGWYSDHDSLVHGAMREELFEMVRQSLVQGGATATLVCPQYPEHLKLPIAVEQALSLPDLVSGLLADWLPSPLTAESIHRSMLKREHFDALASLSLMGDPSMAGGPPGKIHISVVDLTSDGWIHQPVALGANRLAPQSA